MMDVPERRAEERDACEIAARIELAESMAVAVALTDISSRGVRLRVADSVDLPEQFDLLIPLVADLEQRCRLRAVWRKDGALGAAVLSVGDLAAEIDDHPKPAGPATDAFAAMEEAVAQDEGKAPRSRRKRLASIKETGEELPQEEWERFERADKKPKD